jgi:DNA-binding transcriptional ArsR family regulator
MKTAEPKLDAIFAALADPTRREILARLAAGEAGVMEIAEPFAMSQPAVSRHLKVLEDAGLIERRREAQRRPCRLVPEPLMEARRWLDGYRPLRRQSEAPPEKQDCPGKKKKKKKKRGGKGKQR